MTDSGRGLGPLGRFADAVTGRVVQSIPPEVILEHVDLDAVLDQVDVNHLLDRIDVNRLLDRVDVDRLLSGVELEALVRRAGIPAIVAETTGSLAGTTLDTVRRQLVSVDALFTMSVDRVMRHSRADELGPPGLVDSAMTAQGVVSGRYAGGITRALAFTIDIAIGLMTFAGVSAWGAWMWQWLSNDELPNLAGPWATIAVISWIGSYFVLATAITGHTVGKALIGLRVVRTDGSTVSLTRSFIRAVALPVSTSLFAIGLLWSLVDRRRRTFHDLIARTVVVYDWGDRPAELTGPLTEFLRRHDGGQP